MQLSICNKELDNILFLEPKKLVIYGEAATGKTNLLLNVVKCSVNSLKSEEAIFYISTEGSTFLNKALKLRLAKENVFFSIAIDQQHLAILLIEILRNLKSYKPVCVIVDSINRHYRVESTSAEGLIIFIEILTLLDALNRNGAYILTSAQVRYGDQEVPGYEYLYRWADIVVYTLREHPFYRVLKIHKPKVDAAFYFDITLTGIRWLKPT